MDVVRGARAAAGLAVAATTWLPLVLAAPSAHVGDATRSPSTWTTRLLAAGPTDPYGLSCATPRRCVAVGGGEEGDGAILTTTNAGTTWTRASAPPGTSDLFAVTCPTATFCMAQYEYDSGNIASISYPAYVVSFDGGSRWTTAKGTIADELDGRPTCAGPSRCYAVSRTSVVYRSTDAGSTWKALTADGWSEIDVIACVVRSTCFAVGPATGTSGALEFGKIVGFGKRVLPVATLARGADLQIQALSCASTSSCAILGYSTAGTDLLRTADAGRTWTTQPLRGVGFPFALSCGDASRCVALGTTRLGHGPLLALTTKNGVASSRTAIASDPYGYDGAISCARAGPCLAAGPGVGEGDVLVRPSARSAWVRRSLPTGASVLSAVTCPSTSACLAVGDGVPMVSGDGGTTWVASAQPPPLGTSLDAVACATTTTCIAGGSQPAGATSVESVLYRTIDGGTTWQAATGVPHDQSISAVACTTSTTCVAATTVWSSPGSGPVESRLLRSTDGGTRWTPLPTLVPYLTGISCGSAADCVAVAWDGGVYETSDAGASWVASSDVTTTFGSVSCVTASMCWASGAQPTPGEPAIFSPTVVYSTTNGGGTWTLRTMPNAGGVGDIACDASTCLLVGTWLGSLETSGDGGTTWSEVSLPSEAPYPSDVAWSPSGLGVVVGGDVLNGAFIATSS